jgi:hypothetical protein
LPSEERWQADIEVEAIVITEDKANYVENVHDVTGMDV